MWRTFFILTFMLEVIWLRPSAAATMSQVEFQQALKAKARSAQSIEMEIRQERVLLAFEDKLVSSGKFYLKFPDQLRWQVDAPYGSAIVFNHNRIAKFERKEDRWQRLDHGGADIIKQIMSQISDWTTGDFTSNDLYNVAFFPPGKVTLTPKSKDLQAILTEIDLQFDVSTFLIKTVILKELAGDYVRIDFSNPKLNRPINERLFATTEKEANQ